MNGKQNQSLTHDWHSWPWCEGRGAAPRNCTERTRAHRTQEPPSSNTAVENTSAETTLAPTVGFHWMAGTFVTVPPERVARVLLALMGIKVTDAHLALESFSETGRGMNGYKCLHEGLYGVKLMYTPDKPDVHVIIPGEACEQIGFRRLFGLFRMKQFRCSRFDWAIDVDLSRMPSVEDIGMMFIKQPERVRTHVPYSNDPDQRSRRLILSPGGSTAYLGSPESEVMLRVYDRRRVGRFELQVMGDAARVSQGWMKMSKGGWHRGASWKRQDELIEAMYGMLRSFLDFVEPSSDSNKSRAVLQPWWEELVGHFDKFRIARSERPKTLQEVVNYISKQVAPTLATLAHFPQFNQWLSGWLESGMTRIKGRKKMLLVEAQTAWDVVLLK